MTAGFSFRDSCESDIATKGNCMFEEWNEWNDICDRNTGCKLPGKLAVLTEAIEVDAVEVIANTGGLNG